jgi:hypothetical protein
MYIPECYGGLGDLGLPGLCRQVQDILHQHPVRRGVVGQVLNAVRAAAACGAAFGLEIAQAAAAGHLPAGARLARAVHVELQFLLKFDIFRKTVRRSEARTQKQRRASFTVKNQQLRHHDPAALHEQPATYFNQKQDHT